MVKKSKKYADKGAEAIVREFAAERGTTLKQAREDYKTLMNIIVRSLYAGKSVKLPGYFRLELVDVPAHYANDPRGTGKKVHVKDKTVVKMRRFKALNDVPSRLR